MTFRAARGNLQGGPDVAVFASLDHLFLRPIDFG